MARIDSAEENWCPTCQTTLMYCYHAGCALAAQRATEFAYVAAAYARAKVKAESTKAWSSEEELHAEHVAFRKAMSRMKGPSGRPKNWTTQPTSLVNWFGGYVRDEIRSELKQKFGHSDEDLGTADPSEATGLTNESRPVRQPMLYLDAAAGGIDNLDGPLGRSGGASLDPPTRVLIEERNEELRREFNGLLAVLVDLTSEMEPVLHGLPPRTLMLSYITDFEHRRRLYVDGSYGVERTSEKAIAARIASEQGQAPPGEQQLSVGSIYNAVRRTRETVIIPALQRLLAVSEAALEGANPEEAGLDNDSTPDVALGARTKPTRLTKGQCQALQTIMTHIVSSPVVLTRHPMDKVNVKAATTSTAPSDHDDTHDPKQADPR